MSAFVCRECSRVVQNPFEQYRERIEYTRVDGQHRALSRTLRDICRDCVELIRARFDNPDGVEQVKLWDEGG